MDFSGVPTLSDFYGGYQAAKLLGRGVKSVYGSMARRIGRKSKRGPTSYRSLKAHPHKRGHRAGKRGRLSKVNRNVIKKTRFKQRSRPKSWLAQKQPGKQTQIILRLPLEGSSIPHVNIARQNVAGTDAAGQFDFAQPFLTNGFYGSNFNTGSPPKDHIKQLQMWCQPNMIRGFNLYAKLYRYFRVLGFTFNIRCAYNDRLAQQGRNMVNFMYPTHTQATLPAPDNPNEAREGDPAGTIGVKRNVYDGRPRLYMRKIRTTSDAIQPQKGGPNDENQWRQLGIKPIYMKGNKTYSFHCTSQQITTSFLQKAPDSLDPDDPIQEGVMFSHAGTSPWLPTKQEGTFQTMGQGAPAWPDQAALESCWGHIQYAIFNLPLVQASYEPNFPDTQSDYAKCYVRSSAVLQFRSAVVPTYNDGSNS